MTQIRKLISSVAIGTILIGAPLHGQGGFPLAPVPRAGHTVAPIFDGWYANSDGSYTLSFGYFNLNQEEAVEIPIGPDNFIMPERFNGAQPSIFTPRQERGVFGITVPAEFRDDDVVWTLRIDGQVFSVPGRVTSHAYELSHKPMALGSRPPAVRVEVEGPTGRGPLGIASASPLHITAGEPLKLAVWAVDDASVRQGDESEVSLVATWFSHSGPGSVDFAPYSDGEDHFDSENMTATIATFTEPGEYVVRVRVDNFAARDSQAVDQCCWTNAYLPVVVMP